VAGFSVNPSPAVRLSVATFTSTGSCAAVPCSYRWLHGDASSTEEIEAGAAQPNTTAAFTYTGPAGPRTVTLTVTDSLGRSSSKTVTFDLVDPAPAPTPTPSPTPSPSPSGFPDASDTGVPDGTTLTPSGGLTINTAGAVIDARDISGPVIVNAPNVTITRSRIRTSASWGVDNNSTGLVIQDSEINGLGSNNTGIGSGNYTLRRVEITGSENGCDIGGAGTVTIEDSYIHDLTTANGAHTDGCQLGEGAHDVLFRHNTISPQDTGTPGSTSAIIMWDETGTQNTRVRIENNLLDGSHASYAVYSPRQPATDIYINNNRFLSGVYGYTSGVNVPTTVTQFTGNTDNGTGGSIRASD
jgi:hypothetical protein